MSQIKGKNTKPEMKLRKILWSKGWRGYRVRNNSIYGKPDIYFPKYKTAVFVDGCFWHKCPECYREPKSRKEFWVSKLNRNVQRDGEVDKELDKLGFKVLRYWEHEIKTNAEKVAESIIFELEAHKKP